MVCVICEWSLNFTHQVYIHKYTYIDSADNLFISLKTPTNPCQILQDGSRWCHSNARRSFVKYHGNSSAKTIVCKPRWWWYCTTEYQNLWVLRESTVALTKPGWQESQFIWVYLLYNKDCNGIIHELRRHRVINWSSYEFASPRCLVSVLI